jgi:zinc protease
MNSFSFISKGFAVLYIILLIAVLAIGGLIFYKHYKKSDTSFFGKQTSIDIPKDKIKKITFENGMDVLVYQDKSIPKVLVQIAYDIGSSIEQPDERGLAHLIEHMIFKGTEKLSESDIDTIARKYGATSNAFTTKDATSYYFEVNTNNWKHFVPILADCMENARFDSQHLASEMKTVVEELEGLKDKHWNLMVEKANEFIFPSDHPYHFPIIGYKSTLLNLNSERLKNFYKKYYRPNRATLFVVGDIDIDEAVAIAKENFEQIKVEKSDAQPQFPFDLAEPTTNFTKIYKQIEKPMLGFFWKIPGLKNKTNLTTEALEFILGTGEGSRLYRVLVEEERVANDVEVGVYNCMQAGTFLILIEPKVGKEKRCREIVETQFEKLITNGVSEQELNKMAKNKKRGFFAQLQSFGGFTFEWIYSYFSTGNEFDVFEEVNKFSKVTSKDVQDFAKKYLDPFLMNEIQILPLPKERQEDILQASKKEDIWNQQVLSKNVRSLPLEDPKFALVMPVPEKLDFSFPKPDKIFELKNGLKVILYKKSTWPFLNMSLKFKDANYFSNSLDGRSLGIMMDMLMEASSGYSKKDHVKFFEDEGVAYSFNSSGVDVSLLSENVLDILKRIFTVLTTPTFPKDSLNTLRSISIDGCQRAKSDPMSVAARLFRELAYKGNAFGWSIDDAIKLFEKLKVSDLVKLHSENVSPSHMILSVVGDIDLETIQKDIEKVFKNWKGDKYTGSIKVDMSKSEEDKKVDHSMIRQQAILLLGKRSVIDIYNKDFLPLQILNTISFSSLGSRLYRLREQTGLFYRAGGAWAAGASRYLGLDCIYAILSIKNIEKAEKSIREFVSKIAKDGVTQDELDMSKQLYLKSLIDTTAANYNLVAQFCSLQSLGLGFDYYDKVLKRVNEMKLEDVNAIAKKYFNTSKMNRVRVGRLGKD